MNEHRRESDKWIRNVPFAVPILTFVLGWGSGIISAAVLYRDHEKRITQLEVCQREQERLNMRREAILADILARIAR